MSGSAGKDRQKEAKARIRREVLGVRDALGDGDRRIFDRLIRERLFELPEWKGSQIILTYLSFGSEADTREIVRKALFAGKRVFCPRITDSDRGEMVFVRLRDAEDVEKNRMGIDEPAGDEVFAQDADDALMIIPGVAFSASLERIGYGGGYYDRYLAGHGGAKRLAICYECQVRESFDNKEQITGRFDVRPEMLLTEKRLYRNDRHG